MLLVKRRRCCTLRLFQWAPTLGGECYNRIWSCISLRSQREFQWAPTLGGECYACAVVRSIYPFKRFQWAPTLGGECYPWQKPSLKTCSTNCFNGHPPLGVNATQIVADAGINEFTSFNGHPPLGVNATIINRTTTRITSSVSMGTHPWG